MRYLSLVFLVLFFLLLSAGSVSALEKFGPHLATFTSPNFIKDLRQQYDNVGTTDWVPILVMIPTDVAKETLSNFFDVVSAGKFWPIIRVFNYTKKILTPEINQFVATLVSVNEKASSFPIKPIYLEFGNEPNYADIEWENDLNPKEYASVLKEFIKKVRNNAPAFKVGNGAMNMSLSDDILNFHISPQKFWQEGLSEVVDQLDVLFFNPYQISSSEKRFTIDGWEWEWNMLGLPEKPIILSEFGYNPNASLEKRLSFIASEYQAYKKGERISLDKVLAILVLLHLPKEQTIKVPIFAQDGSIGWMNPQDGSIEDQPLEVDSEEKKYDKIENDLSKIVHSYLPNTEITPASISKDSEGVRSGVAVKTFGVSASVNNSKVNAASYYTIASSLQTPEKKSTNIGDFFKRTFGGLLDLLGIVDRGNQEAKKFASTKFPQGVIDDIATRRVGRKNVSYGGDSSRVLGFFSSKDNTMKEALPLLQCASLPLGVGDCQKSYSMLSREGIEKPQESPMPSPDSGVSVCKLGTDYCSVDNLAKVEYFGDYQKAKIASQICKLESASNPLTINDRCLPRYDVGKRSRDYSIGLFQVNLLVHCPGALEDNWKTDKSCKILDEIILEECKQRFLDPDENIKKAVQLSANGTNWGPWRRASEMCGFNN